MVHFNALWFWSLKIWRTGRVAHKSHSKLCANVLKLKQFSLKSLIIFMTIRHYTYIQCAMLVLLLVFTEFPRLRQFDIPLECALAMIFIDFKNTQTGRVTRTDTHIHSINDAFNHNHVHRRYSTLLHFIHLTYWMVYTIHIIMSACTECTDRLKCVCRVRIANMMT